MSTSSLKELGILFGSVESMQEYGLAFYAANCMNNEFLSPANTKEHPEPLKNCGVYQLMRTANYKDADQYTDKEAVHPTFVRFIELLGLWHNTIDPQGVAAFDSAAAKKTIDDKFTKSVRGIKNLEDLNKQIIAFAKNNKLDEIKNIVNTFFDTKFENTDPFIIDLGKGSTITDSPDIKEIVFRNLALGNATKKKSAYDKRFSKTYSDSNATIEQSLKNLSLVVTELLKAYDSTNSEIRAVVANTIKILKPDGTAGDKSLLDGFKTAYGKLPGSDPFEKKSSTADEYKQPDTNTILDAALAFRINLNKIYNNDSGDSITYFENIIPYLPKDVKVYDASKKLSSQPSDYLRKLYHDAYKNNKTNDSKVSKDLDTEAKVINFDQIDLSKYVTNTTESAFRDVSDKPGGTFKDDDIEVLVDLAAQKPGDLLYTLVNGKLVKTDGKPVDDLSEAYLKKGLGSKANVGEYMSRCILSDDSKGLETCLEYIDTPDFFTDIKPEDVHPTLAKEVLKKFKFGRHSRTNQPESYENWITRMSNDEKMADILPAIKANTKLVAYLKAMLKLVSDNLAIIGAPQKSTSVSVSNDPVVRNLEAKIPMYKDVTVGLTGDMASAEMMMRGNANFNAGFSTAPFGFALMRGGRRRHVQKGGAVTSNLTASTLENYFSTQISSLLRKNNVTLSTSDQETINGLLAGLKKQELKVEKLINIIGVLNEIYSFAEKTNNLEKSMNIGAILKPENSRVIDYITTRKEEAQRCLRSTTNNTQNITDELCNLTRELAKKVFTPIPNGSVNGDIILF